MTSRRRLTPEDVFGFKNVADAQISPDGELVAFVVGDAFIVDTKYPRSSVWVVPTRGGEARQFTAGPRADTTPRWSPDGQTLAFLSDRLVEGQRQIYLMPRSGGEAVQLTRVEGAIPTPRGLNPLAWSPDGRQIAFLKEDPETEEEKRRKRDKEDVIEFEKNPRYIRLYVADVKSGDATCVSPDGLQVWEFCWAPSGREFAVVASDLPFEQSWYTCRLARIGVDRRPAKTLHQSKRQVSRPAWSPDGRLVAFLSSNWSDRGVIGGGAFVVSADGGQARELSAGHVASYSWLEWTPDSKRLVSAAYERGGMALTELEVASGKPTPLWRGDVAFTEANWPQFSRDRAGDIAVVREDSDSPRDVWLARRQPGGMEWTQLTQLHPQAAEIEIGATEEVRWKGADGWDMQGLLVTPVGASSGRHPMVTLVHGGPTGAHLRQYLASRGWAQLLAAQGVAVFLPNPRGSTGWGLEFAESNIGDMGGKDWEDIQLGIDHLVERGVADPARLGVAGWSYGGFMTAWAVTQTDRFRAAMMGAGIADWRSFHGRSYLCDWDAIHYGDADPYDPDGVYRKFSPITYVKRVRTPTLILHGEEDRDVPVEQSYLFYRALKDLGVETELVVYPREPHGPQEKSHLLDIARRITEWFAKHLEP
jgi:dipeptidyl aminopeptidase/acylaminoacyl peptidase